MSNTNSVDREIVITYFLTRDGRNCNVCKKTITQLIEEAKLKEEITGVERKLPVIIVECIDNSGIHEFDIYNEELMKLYQLACYSCNRSKNPFRVGTSQSFGKSPTREKLDALKFNPTFHRNLHNYLMDNQHICLKELRMASKKLSDGANQVTCQRYFEDEVVTEANKTGRYQLFPYYCGSDHCNGNHVCLRNTKPTKLLEKERRTLMMQWEHDYGSLRETWKNNSATFLKPFLEMEEYIETHCILLKHNFV